MKIGSFLVDACATGCCGYNGEGEVAVYDDRGVIRVWIMSRLVVRDRGGF